MQRPPEVTPGAVLVDGRRISRRALQSCGAAPTPEHAASSTPEKNPMQSRFAIVSLVLAAAAAPAFAADRKVPSADYPTITAAVAAAQPGDRIVVGPGFYAENVVTNVANLQFIGKKAVWDGTTLAGVAGQCLVATGGGTV